MTTSFGLSFDADPESFGTDNRMSHDLRMNLSNRAQVALVFGILTVICAVGWIVADKWQWAVAAGIGAVVGLLIFGWRKLVRR